MRVVNDAPPDEDRLHQGGGRHVHGRSVGALGIRRDVREVRETGRPKTQRIELRKSEVGEEAGVVLFSHAVSLA